MQGSLAASGQGHNPAKVFYWMGILFVALGVVIGGGTIVLGLFAEPDAYVVTVPLGISLLAIFGGVGGLFGYIGHRQLHSDDDVLAKGRPYFGKIFSYGQDRRILMNGQPCIVLNVRYLQNGQVVQSSVNTNDIDFSRYPIGATVEICVADGRAAFVPGSVSDMAIEQEDDLMNPNFDALGTASSLGVSCPNCGANITVPIGMARFCPYCDTKVTLTTDGRVIG